MTATPATVTDWTLVSRAKGGRFYRPVGNVPTGLTWQQAHDLAATVPYSDTVHVWYVPRVSSHAEDRDNVLEDNGRRVPIRWDAAPLVFAPAPVEPEAAAVDLAAVDRSADHMANLAGWHPQSAAAELDHAAANARHIADRDPALAPYQWALADALDRRAAAARPTMTLTAFGAALLDTAECEHGIPMDEPCRACAVAGHEPVDVDDADAAASEGHRAYHERRSLPVGSGMCPVCAPTVGHLMSSRAEDADRHLADCRGCALVEPAGHAYESLIDVPLTVEELRALAANPAAEPGNRQAAAEELAALTPPATWTMRSTRFRQAAARNRTRTVTRRRA